ncbi:MAG: hypothetical protein ACLTER_11325 [Ruminococcus sp.]
MTSVMSISRKAHDIYRQHCFECDFVNRCSDRLEDGIGKCNLPYATLPDEKELLCKAYEIYCKNENCNVAYNDTMNFVIDRMEDFIEHKSAKKLSSSDKLRVVVVIDDGIISAAYVSNPEVQIEIIEVDRNYTSLEQKNEVYSALTQDTALHASIIFYLYLDMKKHWTIRRKNNGNHSNTLYSNEFPEHLRTFRKAWNSSIFLYRWDQSFGEKDGKKRMNRTDMLPLLKSVSVGQTLSVSLTDNFFSLWTRLYPRCADCVTKDTPVCCMEIPTPPFMEAGNEYVLGSQEEQILLICKKSFSKSYCHWRIMIPSLSSSPEARIVLPAITNCGNWAFQNRSSSSGTMILDGKHPYRRMDWRCTGESDRVRLAEAEQTPPPYFLAAQRLLWRAVPNRSL